MSLTFEQAADDILSMLKNTIDDNDINLKLYYENTRDEKTTDMSPWAPVILRTAGSSGPTLGGKGHRAFTRFGVMIVTVNTPSASGLSSSYALAKVVADIYEGESSPNGVWFRNVRINELGRFGAFYQTNVLVDFEYHETK
jgi:hypothetical protein